LLCDGCGTSSLGILFRHDREAGKEIHYEAQTQYSLRNIVSVPRFSGTFRLVLGSVIPRGTVGATMSGSNVPRPLLTVVIDAHSC
jgi:hypothetical protein